MILGIFFMAFVFSCFMGFFWVWLGGVYVAWNWSVSIVGSMFRDFSFDFLFDDVSWGFMYMLLLCGSISLWYCFHYYSCGKDDLKGLHYLMVGFLEVMCLLVLTNSLMPSLIFWEFLGFVSFILVLYYANLRSMRASLVVLVASRFGDVSLFFLVGHFQNWVGVSDLVAAFFFSLVGLTKSAAYPFISWLVEAMRAPTPVSCLVHSSTLVTAGVWFFFRYAAGSGLSEGVYLGVFVISFVTIFISGLAALFFSDLKEVVALSTCNNVSWCLIFFILGESEMALLQLVTHGVCKCCLFIILGDLMCSSGGSQSSVGVYFSRYLGSFLPFLGVLVVVSLCGLPFLGVYFGKHGLFAGVCYFGSVSSYSLLVLGFILSYAYSFRLAFLLLSALGGLSFGYFKGFVLVSLASFWGTAVNWWGVMGFEVSVELGVFDSVVLLVVSLLGLVIGYLGFVLDLKCCFFNLANLMMSHGVVKWLYDGYLWFTDFSLLSLFRWERWLFGLLSVRRWALDFQFPLFSFNAIFLGLGLLLFWYLLFS
uniref:NADH:ubiquinone reductase (H(+)-translocating) n=1 Tax=Metorchis orientalis TaxID=674132 RepID=A0A0M5KJJ4_9TREM|nr:NADH dehydrogenase subunit 5 [Metorchis orientalis]ALD61618.1 NADH dehydrogenase subunit 5 [Metorchis orientalis]